MVVAKTAKSRGERTQKKKVSTKTKKPDIGSKRKLAKFGKKQLEGHSGTSINYVSRTRAIKLLQISLKDFRRLCILKGIYPRDPSKKPIGKTSTAYYAAKDIAYLQHEPILSKFREMKSVAKKIARKLGRKEDSEARRLFENRPRYSLDHVVRERYPTFASVLADLDDGVTLIHLFADLPVNLASTDHSLKCVRLAREWQFYVAKSKSLRKAFVSIKGIYYQAEVRGTPVTWLVPHKFAQDVNFLNKNKEIDFRVMKTFLEFYETLLEFVLFKLYREDLQSNYPPTLLKDAENAGAFLRALRADPLSNPNEPVAAASSSATTKATASKKKAQPTSSLEKVLAETAAKYQKMHGETKKKVLQEQDDDDDDEDEDEVGAEFAENDAEARALLENEKQTKEQINLFKGMRIFLSREVPLDPCEFCVESFGGHVVREDLGDSAADAAITHYVTDRPTSADKLSPNREYVQPQWLFDCINAKMLLPCGEYSPLAKSLPPHLSPFVDDEAEGYRPHRAEEIEKWRQARAGGGGTEALIRATATEQVKAATAVVVETKDEDEEEESSSEDEEEDIAIEEDDEEEEDQVAEMSSAEEEAAEGEEDQVQVQAPAPFIPSTSFKGAKAGFFFRRGPQGVGYYLDESQASTSAEKFNAEKDAKQNIKQQRKNEVVEAKEMRTIMMSKKAKHLYGRMQYGINKKKEEISTLERKRDAVTAAATSTSAESKSAKKMKSTPTRH